MFPLLKIELHHPHDIEHLTEISWIRIYFSTTHELLSLMLNYYKHVWHLKIWFVLLGKTEARSYNLFRIFSNEVWNEKMNSILYSVTTDLPAQCSFPFTYSGTMYYGCSPVIGCYTVNRRATIDCNTSECMQSAMLYSFCTINTTI
jgi:hypothetical protein